MKFVITGSTGNISKPLSEKLIEAGHDVSIITSSYKKIKDIEALGANAIYTMIPPKTDSVDWKKFIYQVADTIEVPANLSTAMGGFG